MKPIRIVGALLIASAAALCIVPAASPALAEGKSQGKGHDKGHGAGRGNPQAATPGAPCPPGLWKKGSCIPPGHRMRWAAGDRFPRDVTFRRVYYSEYGLPRPRSGEFYAKVDSEVYLVSEATRLVVEAILLSTR